MRADARQDLLELFPEASVRLHVVLLDIENHAITVIRQYGLPWYLGEIIRGGSIVRANIKAFVGLDVHKDSIAIAYANADFSEPPRFLGTTATA